MSGGSHNYIYYQIEEELADQNEEWGAFIE